MKDPQGEIIKNLIDYSNGKIESKDERKLYVIAFSHLMSLEELPDFIQQYSQRLIEGAVNLLVQTAHRESQQVKQKEKKNFYKQPQSDDDDDSDLDSDYLDEDDDSDIDDEDENEERMEQMKNLKQNTNEDKYNEELSDKQLEYSISLHADYQTMKTSF